MQSVNTDFCNDYQACAGRELKNNSVCCSAAQGCEDVVSISLSYDKNRTFIRCDGSDGCGNITGGIMTTGTSKHSNSIIYVGGYNPINYIGDVFVDGGANDDIVCGGSYSCRAGTFMNTNNLYCNGGFSCGDGRSNISNISNVYAYGYIAARRSNITDADNVYCGSNGCRDSSIKNIYDSVYCFSYVSLHSGSIENAANVFVFGYLAAYSSDIVNVQKLYCDGVRACASSSITNVSIIEANGTDSLESSNITSGGNGTKMFVTLHGNVVSSTNTWIICQTGDTCVIDCNEDITDVCDMINFICDGICVFKPTASPTTIPTYIPTTPTSVPSTSPTASPSTAPSPSASPSALPSASPTVAPSLTPSSSPTIDYYFHLFNYSYNLDVLFGSTLSQYNTTSLKNNENLQNDMIDQFEESSYSAITNQRNRVLETKINKIWTYHGNNVNDSCQLKNISGDTVDTYKPVDHKIDYLSWLRFEFKFKNNDIKDDWETHLEYIMRLFRNDLSRNSHFINDTISVYYCQLTNASATSTNENDVQSTSKTNENEYLDRLSLNVTISVLSGLFLLSLFGLIDSKLFRRNEIFSIGSIIPAATYFLDVVSGMCKACTCTHVNKI